MDYKKVLPPLICLLVLMVSPSRSTTSLKPQPVRREAKVHLDDFLKPPSLTSPQFRQTTPNFVQPRHFKSHAKQSYRSVEEPSFLQKMASWFFPFGGDSEPAAPPPGNYGPPPPQSSYGPPSGHAAGNRIPPEYRENRPPPLFHRPSIPPYQQSTSPLKKNCNPCNKVPWIPISNSHAAGLSTPQFVLKGSSNTYLPPRGIPNGQVQNYDYSPPPISNTHPYSTVHNFGNGGTASQHVTNAEYLPPPNVLPIQHQAAGELLPPVHDAIPLAGQPIPLPNLSSEQLPPVYNAQHFYNPSSLLPPQHLQPSHGDQRPSGSSGHGFNGYSAPQSFSGPSGNDNHLQPANNINILQSIDNTQNNNHEFAPHLPITSENPYGPPTINSGNQNRQNNDDIQVIKSVPVAEFTSSVEYPINIIQSPLIEISSQETDPSEQSPSHASDQHGSYNTHANSNQQNNNNANKDVQWPGPIFVENNQNHINGKESQDSYVAATNHNISVRQESNGQVGNIFNIQETTQAQPVEVNTFKPVEVEVTTVAPGNHLNHAPYPTQVQTDSPILYLGLNLPTKQYQGFKDITEITKETVQLYTPTSIDHGTWTPSSTLSTSMIPPRIGEQSTWTKMTDPVDMVPPPVPPYVTKKPKQIQIIIPYTANSKPSPFRPDFDSNQPRKVPSNTELNLDYDQRYNKVTSGWFSDYQNPEESKIVTATAQTDTTKPSFSHIPDELYENGNYLGKIPFDILKLQKNIDGWTEQEFSEINMHPKPSTVALKPSKKIPDEYLTTTPLNSNDIESTTSTIFDHEVASSHSDNFDSDLHNITVISNINENLYESNFLINENKANETSSTHSWEKIQVSISPLTKEKVYVVTPQPILVSSNNNTVAEPSPFSFPRFVNRPTPGASTEKDSAVITGSSLSESINNLATTTTRKPSSRNPKYLGKTEKDFKYTPALFGLMDLTSYTPPPGASVETIVGHSKVVTVVTPSSLKKKEIKLEDKKSTTKTSTA